MAVGIFHGYAHTYVIQPWIISMLFVLLQLLSLTLSLFILFSYDCQVAFSPRFREGYGLADGEAVERLWAYLGGLSPILRHVSPGNRHQTLAASLHYFRMSKFATAGWLLKEKYSEVLKSIANNERYLQLTEDSEIEMKTLLAYVIEDRHKPAYQNRLYKPETRYILALEAFAGTTRVAASVLDGVQAVIDHFEGLTSFQTIFGGVRPGRGNIQYRNILANHIAHTLLMDLRLKATVARNIDNHVHKYNGIRKTITLTKRLATAYNDYNSALDKYNAHAGRNFDKFI
jgi:hypothetical protein